MKSRQFCSYSTSQHFMEPEGSSPCSQEPEQQSWIKTEHARGHTAQQCHQGLQGACGECALPYRRVARWVKAFNEGRQNVADMRRPGRPSVSEEEVYALSALLESDQRHNTGDYIEGQ
ncbi:hypothetical protein B7P43_G01585 [Cryptotermes secundus]|uniref:Mos1 transposase HTH domain-containing protein n=1 Tax=Cryptotermes secundus TaxID=105785 RepID=A0A2J7RHV8_9NEOP|nr:hypothetical protein B7P43_G01585 [Cryptotermes secundus]